MHDIPWGRYADDYNHALEEASEFLKRWLISGSWAPGSKYIRARF